MGEEFKAMAPTLPVPVIASAAAMDGGPCRRCGICCRKGGPALHPEDMQAVESGAIPLALLVTLRQGETARDNVKGGGLIVLPCEMIKLRGQGRGWACACLSPGRVAGCLIYLGRPLECRTLECWAPASLEALSAGPYLSRRNLLRKRPELLDLIATHEVRCGFGRLRELAQAVRRPGGCPEMLAELGAMLAFDAALREAASQRGLSAELLPFLLGRPLAELLRLTFGMVVGERDGDIVVRDCRWPLTNEP